MASRIYDQIILFGDSQFEHGDLLVGLLQTAYQHKLEIVKRGFSGYTTREARAIVPHVFQKSDDREVGGKAALVVVWFGTNDAKSKGTSQHREVEEYEGNMKAILQEIEERCGAGVPILLLTPAPCLDSLSIPSKQNTTAASKEVSDAALQLAAGLNKSNVKPVEMMRMLDDAKKRFNGLHDYLVEDGLHIRPEGYQWIFEALMDAISTYYPSLKPWALPRVMADYTHIVGEDVPLPRPVDTLSPQRLPAQGYKPRFAGHDLTTFDARARELLSDRK